MTDITRREFVAGAALAACACAFCPSALALAADAAGPVTVGTLKDFAKDGVVDTFASSHGFFLIRRDGKLYASRSECTHKNSRLKTSGAELTCPKHGSRFALDGTVQKGPAKRPLARCGIRVDADNRVVVDPSKRFDQNQWDDPASFVKAP